MSTIRHFNAGEMWYVERYHSNERDKVALAANKWLIQRYIAQTTLRLSTKATFLQHVYIQWQT